LKVCLMGEEPSKIIAWGSLANARVVDHNLDPSAT
jgi:hypothetical protein